MVQSTSTKLGLLPRASDGSLLEGLLWRLDL